MKRRHGFSLVEVMAALVVLSTAILALVSVQIMALRTDPKSRERHTASLQAETTLAGVRQELWEDFDRSVVQPRHRLDDRFELEVAETLEGPDLKRIDITVYWTDVHGEQVYRLWTKLLRE
ncbi:MAG: prepilin-type N-terminal cleavage/methylation domain-containing protein [Armatimonadetes bacterium]|nr:prepilin-type N-terminal cleavage/methylation domain-containing protein [Armatimonadota bacterium]